ncbi:J domain-containing protein [Ralstonia pseudosolanacearum]|uniref:J domain-containing protein n=1 Tax=Ralstonia solanacearum TaxID=305 RepID=A0AA92IG57_RALSL|nr:J domain-containing protein [Ralstonia pseudosolanacearum]QCX51705.1 J domain-containing protein [Ralstonia pseudosolanacearum]
MTKTPPRSVSIAPAHNKASLTKGQKTFNNLIKQIEKRRHRLRAWERVMPAFQKQYVDELLPLERAWNELQATMACRLDEAWDQKGLTKTERRMISELIVDLAGALIDGNGDAQLKTIYNRHSESDYDSEAATELEEMKSALETMLGVELGDDLDMRSPDEVLQRAHARIKEQQATEDQTREARRAKRKPSAKQLAAQARQEAEQTQMGLSIREVYRKLASALHPDREPDPAERARKTALMQRVNQAYGKNDLLKLLELQLELEHIDQNAIDNIGEDRLKHYNKILKEQLGELDHEVLHVETGFRHSYGIAPFADVSPDTALRDLAHEITELQHGIRDLEEDLLVFADLKTFKGWLKDLKRQRAAMRFDEMPF